MNNDIFQRILHTVKVNELINKNDKILIALSGGADSVFVTHFLRKIRDEYNLTLFAAHVNHQIRGADAFRDEEFSRELCNKLNITFFKKSFDVPKIAKEYQMSEETVGRNVRYDYFASLADEYNITSIVTAHHGDDKIETMLMHLIRGASMDGLSGMDYKNGNIIRPILDINKDEILEYLNDNNIKYCHDYTNDSLEYFRNKIRLSLIPQLETLNPSIKKVLGREAEMLYLENDYLNSVSKKKYDEVVLDGKIVINKLMETHKAIRRRVIYLYLTNIKKTQVDISYDDVNKLDSLMLLNKTGKTVDLWDGYFGRISYGFLIVEKKEKLNNFSYSLSLNQQVYIRELEISVAFIKNKGNEPGFVIFEDDALHLRCREDGDVFYPVGMSGKKKLKDYFIDKKIDKQMRSKIPIFTVNGEIASVVGMRNDRRYYRCNDKNTYKLVIKKM